MKYNIITVSREFGSGGRHIAQKIAEKLGYKYYDKDIITEVAKKTGFAKDYISKVGEYSQFKSLFMFGYSLGEDGSESPVDYVFNAQQKIILDLASKGSCVIVGRSADYILRERKDCLNVFIHGEPEMRCERIMEYDGVDEKTAKKRMRDVDRRRALNYNYYTNAKWGEIKNYDICLNSTEIGFEKCADLIVQLVKE